MTPGTLGGRIRNASPVLYGEDSVDAATVGTVATASTVADLAAAADLFNHETFILAADGAQDITLAESPIEDSMLVTIGACPQTLGTDYTIDGDTLTLVTADGLTGMVVDVSYAYLTTVPDTAEIG